jgi:hypothetical protein|tara:strand:+ start:10224 stop:10418 length:195 start_codon:yes stop_codon:yes gene_type:complete
MNLTFIEMIAQCKDRSDKESIMFVEYIMLKYFNNNNLFMTMKEAIPFIDPMDLEILMPIIELSN